MINPFNDEYFMKQALNEANIAFEANEIPTALSLLPNNKSLLEVQ